MEENNTLSMPLRVRQAAARNLLPGPLGQRLHRLAPVADAARAGQLRQLPEVRRRQVAAVVSAVNSS
jgi:hypothetical protein